MARPILISNGLTIDPQNNIHAIKNILIDNGKIVEISDNPIQPPQGAFNLDATNLIVAPGFIDLHCHLREPGFEYKETIESGTKAAAAGGFTTVCCMPNTEPPIDSVQVVNYIYSESKNSAVIRVLPIANVTRGSKGLHLTDMAELASSGVIGFSDDGIPVSDPKIMENALIYASDLNLPIINHCEDLKISNKGSMNQGWVADKLGLKGISPAAEESMVARDIRLAAITGGHCHIAHVSTSGSVELIKRAKEDGINITCEVTPHHLTLTDELIIGTSNPDEPLNNQSYNTNAKVNPPLRNPSDVNSLITALNEGVIDLIATDHAPHHITEKNCTFDEAAFGISNLETAVGSLFSLIDSNLISIDKIIESLSYAPAKFLRERKIGNLSKGSNADVTIIAPKEKWIVDSSQFYSKGINSPIAGTELIGRIAATIYNGQIVSQQESIETRR